MIATQIGLQPEVRALGTLAVEPTPRFDTYLTTVSRWVTSGDYADDLVRLSGVSANVTDSVAGLNSVDATIKRQFFIAHLQQMQVQVERLESMRGAEAGWDGYKAAPPIEKTLDHAQELLLLFAEQGLSIPIASVSSNGNATLVRNDGTYLDLEVHEKNMISWLVQLPNGPEIEGEEYFDGTGRHLRITNILKHAPGIGV